MKKNDWHNVDHVIVSFADGRSRVFGTLVEAISYVGIKDALAMRQGQEMSHRYWGDYYSVGARIEFRDDLGILIPKSLIESAAKSVSTYRRYRRSNDRFVYRRGPVEGIHCIRGSWYTSWKGQRRHVGAFRAMSAALVDDREDDLKIKPLRFDRGMNPWDDERGRGNYDNVGWKRHRKHQWKE